MKIKLTAICIALLPIISQASSLVVENSRASYLKQLPAGSEEVVRKSDDRVEEIKKNGFAFVDSDAARHLLLVKQGKELVFTKNDDTGLKKNLSELKLGFIFKDMPNSIGYAPAGQRTSAGWSGVTVLFSTKEGSICNYMYMNMKLTNSKAIIESDKNSLNVNSKIAFKDVEGSPSSGFLYRVNWYDENSFNMLECATKSFNKEMINVTFEQAKLIDKR